MTAQSTIATRPEDLPPTAFVGGPGERLGVDDVTGFVHLRDVPLAGHP